MRGSTVLNAFLKAMQSDKPNEIKFRQVQKFVDRLNGVIMQADYFTAIMKASAAQLVWMVSASEVIRTGMVGMINGAQNAGAETVLEALKSYVTFNELNQSIYDDVVKMVKK